MQRVFSSFVSFFYTGGKTDHVLAEEIRTQAESRFQKLVDPEYAKLSEVFGGQRSW